MGDAAYSPLLLPNHGACIGRSARLQLLDDSATLRHSFGDHVGDVHRHALSHIHMHDGAAGGSAAPTSPGAPPPDPPSPGLATLPGSPSTAGPSSLTTAARPSSPADAMGHEFDALLHNKMWRLVPPTPWC